jgi:putative Ca2+/H+ antiporter (TMEM165/GDT1 family)
MGDKTQLLAFSLASRFKNPWSVMAGILVATVANHALAATAGVWVSSHISPRLLAAILAVTFLAFGIWSLWPDSLDDERRPSTFGPFLTTTVLFFLAEMGDKTQLATIALAARFGSLLAVTAGTTLGMLAADGLAVWLGDRLAGRVQSRWVRLVPAVFFFVFAAVSAWRAIQGGPEA